VRRLATPTLTARSLDYSETGRLRPTRNGSHRPIVLRASWPRHAGRSCDAGAGGGLRADGSLMRTGTPHYRFTTLIG
jgi:hypothetical protein